jgi:glycosyltransferase involved in cell wall biosynthesis
MPCESHFLNYAITKLPNYQILYVAYPLLTVSEESAGGAEQMLWTLDREMSVHGISTTVAASAGSCVSGELFSTGDPCTQPDDFERRNREHQDRVVEFIRARVRQGRPFDLVHDQSGSFWPRAAEVDAPVLATLHLPRHFYPPHYFENVPANVRFNCVSVSQAHDFADLKSMLGVVPNGILLECFEADPVLRNDALRNNVPRNDVQRNGLLWLGRICEEKGTHAALEIAARTELNITIAGQIYPFTYHQQYFEREIAPRLEKMANTRFIPSPSPKQKCQLLREARAVLITSLADETSSLVAMEAAASGAPVIAFRRGALPEIVHNGVTGFLVDGVDDAIQSINKIEQIKPEACIQHAREHFSSKTMCQRYARLYAQLQQSQATIVSVWV